MYGGCYVSETSLSLYCFSFPLLLCGNILQQKQQWLMLKFAPKKIDQVHINPLHTLNIASYFQFKSKNAAFNVTTVFIPFDFSSNSAQCPLSTHLLWLPWTSTLPNWRADAARAGGWVSPASPWWQSPANWSPSDWTGFTQHLWAAAKSLGNDSPQSALVIPLHIISAHIYYLLSCLQKHNILKNKITLLEAHKAKDFSLYCTNWPKLASTRSNHFTRYIAARHSFAHYYSLWLRVDF